MKRIVTLTWTMEMHLMNMMRKKRFVLAYIYHVDPFEFGCYKYIPFDLFS